MTELDIVAYAVTAQLELNSLIVGIAYDRFTLLDDNALEFSLGYIFRRDAE